MLHNDPLTQGPKLFAKNCASCHRHGGHDGTGVAVAEPPSAGDLKGFASREWIAGVMDPTHIASTNYFGATKFKEGKMVKFVRKEFREMSPEKAAQVRKVVNALSAEAGLKAQAKIEALEGPALEEGRKLLVSTEMRCAECHQFHKQDEDATAPDLTGYGSREWLLAFLRDAGHPRFYGKRNDHMPTFGRDGILDERDLGLLVDWLRGEWIAHQPESARK